MRILLIAPYYDRNSPGESWSTYKWVEGISARCDTTVLTAHHPGWKVENSPTEARQIVSWVDPELPHFLRRIDWELKPAYLLFYWQARRWLQQQRIKGVQFDIIHQINPLALRYPSPAYDSRTPLIVGPLAGSLPTPQGFRHEAADRQWYRRLRSLDRIRIRRDPWLRATYERAAIVLGAAPYVKDILAGISIRRFEVMAETGVQNVEEVSKQPPPAGTPLRLLFVGRVIRTKGIIDAIRAVAIACRRCHVEFNIVGDGDMLPQCKQEAARLKLERIVRFHGRLSRDEVTRWYRESHVFLFPSFREPSGNVVFEAMAHGLPLICSTVGGPGYVVTDGVGIRVEPTNPHDYAASLAKAVERLAMDPQRLAGMSRAALTRIRGLALWPEKINRLLRLYSETARRNVGGRTFLPGVEPPVLQGRQHLRSTEVQHDVAAAAGGVADGARARIASAPAGI